ncbi:MULTISPECIES: 2-dehydro-3-deoxy-D-gluconate 5-dehydrogenase KduD [unclassified Mesorhizobium]|uniref:2-dehydro-3-deoxy-D-gluconate 5-dehydrogenase KduD n=1 Tax=unclassified Mesorhizobium TaxID=325217 RepID=UPI00112D3F66|nr:MULTISPECIES: 2-dehydro-3-deoxy-D-gluconate 5-dehydrogenase KduD [unclassified Mesorhizobium]TPK55614.1 2-dehydro-3-deoxy-D-gluconate 5-dehydrogenase KduD [Mesorhizobium sp. B2-5-2]TPL17793.1 2-dehydro-3-deoxy-D-gluconate 5-dehydrogenase KduD [Mesorhizobium sp. B2-4-7]TPL31267.1 2-dehydro-3-deoxy-D-gluconate 5-dehydrogenase KduD [Mesorhizobium sp. B2-4-9]TPL35895.1 2-dehydro-3-deoxy-D-gluconate 5-dehydrogenase KduD [Mesorhizobium sp. B2-4-5]TPM71825.1 2-dehydro-3-deoxy-D-gluconate 5-dehydro
MSDLSAFSLTGRRILVTGANTGIGQGIAVSIARAGGMVVGVGRSSMDETAARIAAAGGRFEAVAADLADTSAAGPMLERVWDESGPLDGLVNNAGIIRRADAVDLSEADWDEVLDLNLKTAFLLCQGFGRRVLAGGRRGKIVNIASVLSFQGGIRVASYTASKHGVLGITRLLACEWAAKGINVNGIAPGYIETNNTQALRADPDRSASILARIPAGRWGRPEDIGDAAAFLLAPASDYMHGAVVPVDGGWLAR